MALKQQNSYLSNRIVYLLAELEDSLALNKDRVSETAGIRKVLDHSNSAEVRSGRGDMVHQVSLTQPVKCTDIAHACPLGDNCQFAHGSKELRADQKKSYKTELCKNWEENESCSYGEKCKFAHGIKEVRDVKTKFCRHGAACPYGHQCPFLHSHSLTE